MDPANAPVVEMLNQIADILEMTGSDRFRPIAYRRAARTVEALPKPVAEYIRDGTISELPGIGDAISQKIKEFVETGKLEYLEGLKKGIPPTLMELLKLQDMGPKKVGRLYLELGITDMDALEKACLEHKIRGLRGFGEKTEAKILHSIRFYRGSRRFLLAEGDQIVEKMLCALAPLCTRVDAAGSLRRRKETIGDLDIIAASTNPQAVIERFVSIEGVENVLSKGEKKSSITLSGGMQVDLRVVDGREYGAALLYFTGSKDHNVELRNLSIEKGFKLNEYGLFKRGSEEVVAGATEEEVYGALGLDYIVPELREARGEIQAAASHKLPHLIEEAQVKGDLHLHTNWSDGSSSLEEMVAAAKERGYAFAGIADHSASQRVANGLSVERMKKQIERVRKLAEKTVEMRLLCGSEVDILPDGSLDYPDTILKDLDFVIASVHSRFNMEKKEMTERIIKAISNEHVTALGHPTGRQLGKREAYAMDTDAVFQEAAEKGVLLEINGSPERLDLNDSLIIEASKFGGSFLLSTDSHHTTSLSNMRYAVAMARRGWLTADAVGNTRSTFKAVGSKQRGAAGN
ncbi:MAG: DNA polymerase/3'-5' exonuclease PolX [Methanomassiliicoccales archaeon]